MMERPLPSAIPSTPGVYLYKDTGGHILYVGKARDLRRRVLSYFRPDHQLTAKTKAMLSHAVNIEYLNTTTEKEALLLEASLIKKHRPHYNICLRDDKQYVMFRLSEKEVFPRLEIVRRMKKRDGALYFGPFTAGQAARETWKTIHRIFPLRRCSDKVMKNRETPCLYHHIHLCSAPCTGEISPAHYADLTHRVRLLLSGGSTELIDVLRKSMEEASDSLDFEKAAELRDQIRAIQKTVEKQSIVLHNTSDMDVLGLLSLPEGLALGIVFVRYGLVQDRNTFFWPGLGLEDATELLWSFLGQFYHEGRSIPSRIILPYPLWEAQNSGSRITVDSQSALVSACSSSDMKSPFLSGRESTPCFCGEHTLTASQRVSSTLLCSDVSVQHNTNFCTGDDDNEEYSRVALESWLSELRGNSVRLSVAHSEEERSLLEIARSNARESIKNRKENSLSHKLATAFHHDIPIIRIECVDVSHTGGTSTKVGVVVYEDGRPIKEDYRVWNIEGTHGDDYAALSMWAQKRLGHGAPWPDLLLIDGGKGQLATVYHVLCEALATEDTQHRLPFLVAGIAKARNEQGYADRRAGNVADRIFIPGRSNPLNLREGCPELLFLQTVRDAAHDFSIGRHRQARAKQAFSGELRSLPGIGSKTAKLLWEYFDSIHDMKSASQEQIKKIPGIGNKKAEAIFLSLQKL